MLFLLKIEPLLMVNQIKTGHIIGNNFYKFIMLLISFEIEAVKY